MLLYDQQVDSNFCFLTFSRIRNSSFNIKNDEVVDFKAHTITSGVYDFLVSRNLFFLPLILILF